MIDEYRQVCSPLEYSLFYLDYEFDPNHISVLDSAQIYIAGADKYGNKLTDPLIENIIISLSKMEKNSLNLNMIN